ncbi:competence type IV pilus minor pilin ComGG [Scopulibacillus cellulosilyticus]|uniref:Competence type IV pilus minor pilin ComGG n=1 Tax=Scopulibacillus cellulosilyticus TaxID=2665665 RepID=A0ABW2PY33_9BACL
MKQNGFILPLTVIIVSIFTFFLLHMIIACQMDRDFLRERLSLFEFGELSQLAKTDILAKIKEKDFPKDGSMHYEIGNVDYQTKKVNENVIEVTLSMQKNTTKQKQIFYFDVKQSQIVKWVEGL